MLGKVKQTMLSMTPDDINQIKGSALALLTTTTLTSPVMAFAASDVTADSTMQPILNGVAGVAIVIGAIVFVVLLVQGIFKYLKGEETIGKIVIKCLCVLLIIGLMVVAANIGAISKSFSGVADKGVGTVSDVAENVLN